MCDYSFVTGNEKPLELEPVEFRPSHFYDLS